MKKEILKFIIDKARRSRLIQSVFEQPIDLNRLSTKGTFRDSFGFNHIIYEGLRTKIKPGWERIFKMREEVISYSKKDIKQMTKNGRIAADRMESLIGLYTDGIKNKRILEIGCSAGGTCFALAEKGASEVTGTDFSGYKSTSLSTQKLDPDQINKDLTGMREQLKMRFNRSSKVEFLDDDICNSNLKQGSFDIVCSWDVLEHLSDPLNAFISIRNLLSENGISVHEYNPFFSLNGGHSACTIDFPWGHVLLKEEDFEEYNKQFFPDHINVSMSFYRNGINRMNIHDLQVLSSEAGLEILSLIAFPKEQDLRLITSDILFIAKKNYPDITLNDLISPRILVVQKKIT